MNTILKSADDSKDNSSSNNNSNNNKASDAIGIKVTFLKALRLRIFMGVPLSTQSNFGKSEQVLPGPVSIKLFVYGDLASPIL